MNKLVTVVIATHNRCNSLERCIESLLIQSFKAIELIIVDDCSTDSTVEVIKDWQKKDPRIKAVFLPKNRGPAAARNEGIRKATGEIIFFCDDDVIARKNWIEKGREYFNLTDCIGIEGKIIYYQENYRPCYSDRIVENKHGDLYMTANAAYRKNALISAGLFDTSLRQYEDRALAMKIKKHGKIYFASNAIVTHQKEKYTLKTFFFEAKKIEYKLMYFKLTGETQNNLSFVFEPKNLACLIFPPLVLVRLATHRFCSGRDLFLFLLIYPRLFYERLLLWKYAKREGLKFI